MMTSYRKIVTSFPFFSFYNQFGAIQKSDSGRIVCETYLKLIFTLVVTIYLTKNESKTEKSLTQLSYYCFKSRYFFGQKTLIFAKNADFSKIEKVLALKGIFSKITYLCVLTYQISGFLHISNEFRTEGNFTHPAQPKTNPLKSPPRLGFKQHVSLEL